MSTSRTAEPRIATQRLLLRPARAGDLHDLNRVYSDPRSMRYWSDPPHPDIATTQRLLDGLLAPREGPRTYLVIEHDGRAIGTAGIHARAEVGYILHSDHWGQGLATEALGALIPWLFEVTGAPELTADIDPRNVPSGRVLEKLGFHRTGYERNTFCVNGEWSDSAYFALPRP